jgi:hypothetical protein
MSFSITSSESFRSRARTYVVAAIAMASAEFVATMAANVLIDPQGVFGTDLFNPVMAPNVRYLAAQAYEAAPDRYDGVLFASSRGEAFDRELLAGRLGVRAVADFSVPDGLMTDHLPTLEFLLRDKAARGLRLTAAFLLLDADLFGTQPWTDNNIDSFLPPEISGESRWRFWWRYLTVFQFTNWRRYIDRALANRAANAHGAQRSGPKLAAAGFMAIQPREDAAGRPSPVVKSSIQEAAGPRIRPDLAHQLGLFARFVALCRENQIRLVVAFSPLNRQNEYAGDAQAPDNERVVGAIARITPVWDFGRPAWLSDRRELWYNAFHYNRAVGNMMLQRIFGEDTAAPADFGQLKSR